MNRTVTSKESILAVCKDIVRESGMSALNMRRVAQRTQVSVGSVYNYFPSKEDLILATVESIWNEILSFSRKPEEDLSFTATVRSLYDRVQTGSQTYPLFLIIHAMNFTDVDKIKGRTAMDRFFGTIEAGLLKALNEDPHVRKEVFQAGFTQTDYVRFIISNVLALIISRSSGSDFLEQIIRRTIY